MLLNLRAVSKNEIYNTFLKLNFSSLKLQQQQKIVGFLQHFGLVFHALNKKKKLEFLFLIREILETANFKFALSSFIFFFYYYKEYDGFVLL